MMKKKTRNAICSMLSLAITCGVWAESNTTTKATGKYKFRLVAVEADANHGAIGRFAFRHQAVQPIQLYGFGFTGTNVFKVRFEEFQREQDGKWSKVEVAYCGTGAQLYQIEPNTDYIFLVPLWPFLKEGQKGMVAIPGTNVTVTSDAFDTAEIRKK